MFFPIFAVKNQYYKNGIWWFTKMLNRLVALRIKRRVLSNKFFYLRQQILYRLFVEQPWLANMIGIYPKVDSSHGFGFYNTYQMYRDFQENTINSDGAFGMWLVILGTIYLIHEIYNYFLPWYWNRTASVLNGEQERTRMRDAIASTLFQETAKNIDLTYQ